MTTSSRVLEHIVSKHIGKFLFSQNIFNKYQHGFLEGLSTVTQLVEAIHYIAEMLDRKGQEEEMIYFYFNKALHQVSHRKSVIKLRETLEKK